MFAEAQEKDIHEPVREDDGEFDRQRKERIPRTKADIARCWAKYCLNLIKEGKEKRENAEGEEESREDEGRPSDKQFLYYSLLLCLLSLSFLAFLCNLGVLRYITL